MNLEKDILDHYFMQIALDLAQQAFEENEIPVGDVVTCGDRIIGKGYNQTERLKDVTAHAEMLAITAAADHLGAKYLQNCTLYVTLEPCIMCAGALNWSQISRVVIGAKDEKRGFLRLGTNILHPKTELKLGLMADESKKILQNFFVGLRT